MHFLAALAATALLLHAPASLPQDGATTRPSPQGEIVDVRAQGQEIPQDVAARHVPTGLIFPASFGIVGRVDMHAYDPAARDVSAGYNHLFSGLALTIYVYPLPEGTTLEAMFRRAAAEVVKGNPDLKPLAKGSHEDDPRISPPAGGPMWWAMFESEHPTGGYPVPIASVLTLAELAEQGNDGRRYLLKIRATYPVETRPAASEKLRELLNAWQRANGFTPPAVDPPDEQVEASRAEGG